MSTYIALGDLAGCVFPYDCQCRHFLVLKAYLDDSGTHDNSDVIVMAGLIATERAWDVLEPQWDALLTKYDIERRHAHMNRCKHRSVSSFDGWSDFKRHRALTEFRRLIVDTRGRLLASSVSRKTWNAVCAKTRLGEFFKNPIDMLHAHCLRKALETKRAGLIMGQERISVTFDRRVQSLVSWNWMTLGFVDRAPERFAGYSFGESENILPLQAADMIAYESFVYQCDWMKKGTQPKLRPNFGRLMNSLERNMGFFTERQLVDYAQDVEARVARRRQS